MAKENYKAWEIQEKDFPKKGTFKDKVEFLLVYASLAPSSHNAQPWNIKIKQNTIIFSPDFSRLVPVADKDNRFLYLGLGCFYKNFEVAANYFGFKVNRKTTINDSILSLELELQETVDKGDKNLFNALPKRLTNRNTYKEDLIDKQTLNELNDIAKRNNLTLALVTDENKQKKIIELTKKGDSIVWNDPEFQDEHLKWVRNSLTKRTDGMPAFTVGIPLVLSFFARPAIKKLPFAKMQATKNEKLLNSTPYYCFLLSETHNPETWEKAGEALEEIWLRATSKGLAVAPLAQIIEVQELYKEAMEILGTKLRPQVFFRLGYPTKEARHSPRRSVKEVLVG